MVDILIACPRSRLLDEMSHVMLALRVEVSFDAFPPTRYSSLWRDFESLSRYNSQKVPKWPEYA